MKYLLIKRARYSMDYEIREFATLAEIHAEILQHGIEDAIVAQRLGVEIAMCEWSAPAALLAAEAESIAA